MYEVHDQWWVRFLPTVFGLLSVAPWAHFDFDRGNGVTLRNTVNTRVSM
jgi:hypothetical protein